MTYLVVGADAGQAPLVNVYDAVTGGFGLSGMAERAELVGGHLHVHSGPGRGTTIEGWVRSQPAAL